MEKIYGKHKLVGLQLFLSGTPTFSSGTPTFCQMGVLNSCFQNPSESSDIPFCIGFGYGSHLKATLFLTSRLACLARLIISTWNSIAGFLHS